MGELLGEAAVGELLWGRCCTGAAVGNCCGGIAGLLWESCCGLAAVGKLLIFCNIFLQHFLQHFWAHFRLSISILRPCMKRQPETREEGRLFGSCYGRAAVGELLLWSCCG